MTTAAAALLASVIAQIGWTFLLYVWLTVARFRAVQSGKTEWNAFVLGREEPLPVARITRNLANQFELPTIFYALAVLLIALGSATWLDAAAGWVFVAGRVLHTGVQTLTDDVRLRGRVFTVNFLALVVITGHVALVALDALRAGSVMLQG